MEKNCSVEHFDFLLDQREMCLFEKQQQKQTGLIGWTHLEGGGFSTQHVRTLVFKDLDFLLPKLD